MLHTAVAQRQLAATTPAADEPSEQRLAMLGRAMMTARGHVTGDHCTDRFEPLPVHIAFVGVRLEDEPLGARLPADLRACAKDAVPRRYGCSTIGVGSAVDRVLDHPVESRVAGPPPGCVAVRLLHR